MTSNLPNQPHRSLTRLSLAILEQHVRFLLGDAAIAEIKAPVREQELRSFLERTLRNAENRFTKEALDPDVRDAVLNLPLSSLPSISKSIRLFYDRPADPSFGHTLSEQIVRDYPHLSTTGVNSAVDTYLKILRQEMSSSLGGDDVRDRLNALAIQGTFDNTSRMIDTLEQISAKIAPPVAQPSPDEQNLRRSLRTRLKFLDGINDDANVVELEKHAQELVGFVKTLQHGTYFAQKLAQLTRRPKFRPFMAAGESPAQATKRQRALMRHDKKYRDQLRAARDGVYGVIDELLSLLGVRPLQDKITLQSLVQPLVGSDIWVSIVVMNDEAYDLTECYGSIDRINFEWPDSTETEVIASARLAWSSNYPSSAGLTNIPPGSRAVLDVARTIQDRIKVAFTLQRGDSELPTGTYIVHGQVGGKIRGESIQPIRFVRRVRYQGGLDLTIEP